MIAATVGEALFHGFGIVAQLSDIKHRGAETSGGGGRLQIRALRPRCRLMIYLDANATTPIDPAVLEAMLPFLRENWSNASASHAAGRKARRAIEAARERVAALIGVEAREVVFTSGATESINAVHASVRHLWPEKRFLITTKTEHAAGLECATRWQQSGGEVRLLGVDQNGLIDLAASGRASGRESV